MAEEQKTDTPTHESKKVEMTQEEFDAKFNSSFGKGAAKANAELLAELGVENLDSLKGILKAKADADEAAKTELEKALDAVEAMKTVNAELISKGEKLEEKSRIAKLASSNEVKDADYFEFKYSQAKKADDFNEKAFIEDFVKGNPIKPPKTDDSGNERERQGKDLRNMSINELKAYQATL